MSTVKRFFEDLRRRRGLMTTGAARILGDMSARQTKGIDVLGLVKLLKIWRKQEGVEEIPGLRDNEHKYFGHERVLSSGWYPFEVFLHLLHLTHRLVYGGTHEGILKMGRDSAMDSYQGAHAIYMRQGDPEATIALFIRGWPTHHSFGEVKAEVEEGHAVLYFCGYEDVEEVHGLLHVGWLEAMLELAGAVNPEVLALELPWQGDEKMVIDLRWD